MSVQQEQSRIEIAKGFYEIGWNNRDIDYLKKIMDPDYHPLWILMEEKGADLVAREIRYLTSCIPDLKFEIIDLVPDGDKVWIWVKMTGTQTNEFFGFPPSNKSFVHDGAAILYFNSEHKIANRMAFYNFQEVFTELGHIPPYWELSKLVKDS